MTNNPAIARLLGFVTVLSLAAPASGQDIDIVKESDDYPLRVEITKGRQYELVGEAISASEGVIGSQDIEQRPVLRAGEILEFVPGMVVTQHSGSGKANQYFLRGFNLDHGTDFRTTVDSMPVNMRTHGHGQGYTDLSFIVPEFVDTITYQKGPYRASDGDFSTAGSARFSLMRDVRRPWVKLEAGQDSYYRAVMAGTQNLLDQDLTLGLELQRYDGPWTDIDEDVDKLNGFARLDGNQGSGVYSLMLMAYDNSWNSADQIPERAVTEGIIDRLGSLDDKVGGDSSRYSLSYRWQGEKTVFDAYIIESQLDLFSNFTYFLDDPVNGDQFEQVDERTIYGSNLSHDFWSSLGQRRLYQQVGLQLQFDDIEDVALHRTLARQRLSTVRQDQVEEYSAALYWDASLALTPKLTSFLGVRYDYLAVDVTSDNPANSGEADDSISSIKGGLSYQFDPRLELYLNAGQSFHSNDARGATITVDPNDGSPVAPVDLLVRGEGGEVGIRYQDLDHLSVSLAVWMLELDSELLFVGDAGNTEPSRASRRAGIEMTAYYWITNMFSADLELAWTRSRFTEDAPGEGNYIDGSLPFVASTGIAYRFAPAWSLAVRMRYFGERTLDSFNSQKSDDFTVTNAGLSYDMNNWQFGADVLNVFDSTDHDIDYFYTSRLAGEPAAGVDDIHFHPIEPRTVRVKARYQF